MKYLVKGWRILWLTILELLIIYNIWLIVYRCKTDLDYLVVIILLMVYSIGFIVLLISTIYDTLKHKRVNTIEEDK